MQVESQSDPKSMAAIREYLEGIIDYRTATAQDDPRSRENDRISDLPVVKRVGAPRGGSLLDRRQQADCGQIDREAATDQEGEFIPFAPQSLDELGIRSADIEALVLKFLLNAGPNLGVAIAKQISLPLQLIGSLLRKLKEERLLVYKSAAAVGDYVYELTESGCERAHRHLKQSTYFGAAPVALEDYVASVSAQSIRKQSPKVADLKTAMDDLMVKQEMLIQLTQAANSGLGLFLYGASGNGKTSIARRITNAFGQAIWIPRAISVTGTIIRLYDPNNHQALPLDTECPIDCGQVDQRWIRIRRPTIIAGGELTMDNLEITANEVTSICEAPIQLKSNCGTLLIDDFGRQRVSPSELLNRWIVPLEKHFDILNLANGRKIQVPFDQLLVLATNLEPRDLVDEAFLRRIPYKIDVKNPSENEFRTLIKQLAYQLRIKYHDGPVDYLIEKYYEAQEREMRYCHPRDLMHQVHTYCTVLDLPIEITNESIDTAAKNYFALL